MVSNPEWSAVMMSWWWIMKSLQRFVVFLITHTHVCPTLFCRQYYIGHKKHNHSHTTTHTHTHNVPLRCCVQKGHFTLTFTLLSLSLSHTLYYININIFILNEEILIQSRKVCYDCRPPVCVCVCVCVSVCEHVSCFLKVSWRVKPPGLSNRGLLT